MLNNIKTNGAKHLFDNNMQQ